MIYDLIIIGAGPAGITAGIYAARKKMDFLIVTGDVGGQAGWSGDVENYTGYQFVTGPELVAKFEEHIKQYGIRIKENEEAVDIKKTGNIVFVTTKKSEYQARAVIIASGKYSRELNVPGEKEFKNKGLTYCATCDGPLFAGKDVAVIGGGNSALDAALQLIKIAKKIYLVNIADKLTGDPVMMEKVLSAPSITVLNSAKVAEITGERFVSGIKISEKGLAEKVLSVQGIFVEIGLVPNSRFARGIEKNELGEIIINKKNETNIPGIFAAGDVTDITEKQIIIAAGEGSKATLEAFRYLSRMK
jgi:NADH-dependent peroxiredoxin subunit F